jgi:peptidoglycan/LPS O-acetylase OafA/YrhL
MEPIPKRFYSLDAARGLAALCVVFYHWQHFSFDGTRPIFPAPDQLPLYGVFSGLYFHGYLAVHFFFSLSGFVFFWLYSDGIASRAVVASKFWALRISRLYPLHILTLLFAALMQSTIAQRTGDFFAYSNNDLHHFLLQVGFVSSWGFESGDSFNGPSWSVSVEVLLYAVFFLMCRYAGALRRALILPMIVVGLALHAVHAPVGEGIFSFFLGGLAYHAYLRIRAAGFIGTGSKVALVLLPLLWLVAIALAWSGPPPAWTTGETDPGLGEQVSRFLVVGLLFPLTILALTVIETARGSLLRCLAFLGDWSYSTYLLHFPLQLGFVLALQALGKDRSFFTAPLSLLTFFALLLVLSWLSFRFYELPARRAIRAWYRRRSGH